MSLGTIFLIAAVVCFILELIGVKVSISLLVLGLLLWVIGQIVGVYTIPTKRGP